MNHEAEARIHRDMAANAVYGAKEQLLFAVLAQYHATMAVYELLAEVRSGLKNLGVVA